MKQAIPWATSVVTLYAMWAIGRKRWWGWLVGLTAQAFWALFIVLYHAWGLLPLNVALTVLYSLNLLRWRRDEVEMAEVAG